MHSLDNLKITNDKDQEYIDSFNTQIMFNLDSGIIQEIIKLSSDLSNDILLHKTNKFLLK